MSPTPERPEDRFARQTVRNGDCLLFQGALNWGGYGKFWFNGRTMAAHKYAYEVAKGPVPDGATIDHLCRTRHCVEASHLEAVTLQENLQRALLRPEKRTHCPQGHEYTLENTRMVASKYNPYRSCITCSRDRSREWQRKKVRSGN